MFVFVFAMAAAVLFALGSVVQQRAASMAPPEKALSIGLLLWLLRQRAWLGGMAASIVGNLFSAEAIGRGGVALAQPLFTSRLLFALALTAVIGRLRIPRRDWLAALMTAAGLALFVVVGRPHKGPSLEATTGQWLPAIVAVAAGVAILVVVARRRHATSAAFVLGAGAGLLFGLQSSLTESSIDLIRHHGVAALVLHWQPWLLLTVAIYGAVLIQSAYEMAPLPASFPPLVTVEPLTGLVIGVTVLHGSLHVGDVGLAAEVGGLVIMVAGVAMLARSPLVTGQLYALERRREEGLAYRCARELEHLLGETETTVGHYWESARARVPRRERETHVEKASRHLQRLEDLLVDMNRLRGEEVRHLRELPVKERLTLAPLEAELDQRQERIEAWSARLHVEFERLCEHREAEDTG